MSTPTPLPRVREFERLGFGLFLHWGLYSQIGAGEWIQHQRRIPRDEYAKLKDTFTADGFDAPAIARLARESGMRYVTLTTRHHEGFSLYDTRGLSDFDSVNSPAGRDLVQEFVEACRAEGIVPFFYHTTLDWRWDWANISDTAFEEYLDYFHASVEVLCKHYGKIGGLWFDGNWSKPTADWKESRLYGIIRQNQPEAIIVNNTGLFHRGALGHPELDVVTFEQGLPSAPDRTGWPKYLAGEMCETINTHWGVGNQDFNFKSVGELITHLCACRKVGANYLLNVGPEASGAIPEYEAASLRKVGQWIQGVGEVLYDGVPVPVFCQGKDFVLSYQDKFYYFVHGINRTKADENVGMMGDGHGPRVIQKLPARISSVRWLDNDESSRFSQSEDNVYLTLDCPPFNYGTARVVRVAELS